LGAVTDVEIRPITPDDDFGAQLDLGQRAFGVHSAQQAQSWLHVARLRAGEGMFLGAFAGGVPAGAAMLHDMRQYWLGSPVRCAGVASVKVAPEHRGMGIGRLLMTERLGLIADRGYPLSALFPATVPIYRSLGWELAGAKHEFTVPARSLRELQPPDPQATAELTQAPRITRATPDDARRVIKAIGRSHLEARDAGPITWDEGPSRQWLDRPDLYAYLAESAVGREGDDGFAAYRWAGGDTRELWVERVHATTPQALRALWSVIASNASVTRTVRGWTAPGDPFWWLTAERDATISRRAMWMLRVVDIQAAIEARGFPPGVTASVPLRINDKARPGNAGRWLLTVDGGKGALIPNGSMSSPDPLTLGPRGVAALYAGIPVATLRMSGLASGGTPEAGALLDAAFAATPFMVDDF
jgi:predicted N-acetyltransferase YhbS